KSGTADAGIYEVTVKKVGYETLTIEVALKEGSVVSQEFRLKKEALSIEDELLSEINVYPNPFKDFLQVDYSFRDNLQTTAHLVLTNIKGQEIYRLDINSKEGSLLLDKDIEAGVYFVQIFNGTKMSRVVRVVKE
ncbi:MAG: T9SS type A sorting domain-containing protein, partial [Flavobacteriales bacterium]|nr:T9SS type A sorting domain-containing protein [Flavobacteriales bacterium]